MSEMIRLQELYDLRAKTGFCTVLALEEFFRLIGIEYPSGDIEVSRKRVMGHPIGKLALATMTLEISDKNPPVTDIDIQIERIGEMCTGALVRYMLEMDRENKDLVSAVINQAQRLDGNLDILESIRAHFEINQRAA